ncbi:uncharacterized protein CLUP02_14807, partial [Colletotrichum lupini]
ILLFIGSARTTQGSSSVTLLGSAISQPNLPTSLEAAGLHLIPSPSTQSGRHPFFPAAAQPLSASLCMNVNLYPYGAFAPGFCFSRTVPPGGSYRLCWLVRYSLRIHLYRAYLD